MQLALDPEFEKDLAFVAGEKEPELFTPAWWVASQGRRGGHEMTWRDWVRQTREVAERNAT